MVSMHAPNTDNLKGIAISFSHVTTVCCNAVDHEYVITECNI